MKAFDGVKILVAIVLLGASTNILASTPQKPFEEKYIKQAVYSIDNSVPAIVESSIRFVVQLKNIYPNENYNRLIDRLEDLAANGTTVSIRYKAQLARIYFNYYDIFKDIKTTDSENSDDVFKMIANRIESNSFAVN